VLAKLTDTSRGKLSAVQALEQIEDHGAKSGIDPCDASEEFAVTLDHRCSSPVALPPAAPVDPLRHRTNTVAESGSGQLIDADHVPWVPRGIHGVLLAQRDHVVEPSVCDVVASVQVKLHIQAILTRHRFGVYAVEVDHEQ
jgi:hypothetical protein